MGLDNLDNLDVNNIDESMLEDMDLNNYGSIDVELEVPHLKLNTKELSDVLKVAKSVTANNSRDLISRAVCIKSDGLGKIRVYCTDYDVYLEQSIQLLNTEKVLEEAIIVHADTLLQLIKAVPATTVIFKDEEGIKLNLVGGSVFLENHQVDIDKFTHNEDMKITGKLINSSLLNSVIKDFSPLVSSAISPSEKRIVMGDRAISTYMLSSVFTQGDFPKMDLRVKDMGILKQLTSLDKEEELSILQGDAGRVAIEGSEFKYTFLISDLLVNQTLLNTLDTLDYTNGVFIDYLQIYKIIELSSDLSYSTGKVGMQIDNNICNIKFKTRKDKDSILTIEGLEEGSVAYKEEVEIQSKLLRIMLKSFAGEAVVKVNITKEALILSSDKYKSVLFIG